MDLCWRRASAVNIALREGGRQGLREDADLHHIDSEAVVRRVLGCERGLGVVHRGRQGIRVRYDKGENGGQRAGAEGERACGGGGRLKRLANECGAEKDTHKKGASADDEWMERVKSSCERN